MRLTSLSLQFFFLQRTTPVYRKSEKLGVSAFEGAREFGTSSLIYTIRSLFAPPYIVVPTTAIVSPSSAK